MEPAPPFETAVNQLKGFLRSQGWTSDILWRRPEDVLRLRDGRILVRRRTVRSAAAWARRYFESGRRQQLGIAIEATCEVEGTACATVLWTADPVEATYRLIPERGLKLSVATPARQGSSVTALTWWIRRRIR